MHFHRKRGAHSKASQKPDLPFLAIELVIALVVALGIELFACNYTFFESLQFQQQKPVSATPAHASVEQNGTVHIERIAKSIELSFENAPINNIHIVCSAPRGASVDIYAVDEGHASPYRMGSQELSGDDFFRLHAYGNVSALTLDFSESQPENVSLQFNVAQPLRFSLQRFALFAALLFVSMALIQAAAQWNAQPTRRFWLICGALSVCCIFAVTASTQAAYSKDFEHHHQYHELACALAEGHVWLDAEPSAELMAMPNPYDTQARKASGVSYLHDHAYRNGKYYVYFGVLPVLLFHLPWYILTGGEFANWIAAAICTCLFACGMLFLLASLLAFLKRHLSCGTVLVLYVCLLSSSCIACTLRYPDLYSIPITLALALSVWGLALWVRAVSGSALRLGYGIGGSACMALVLLARPQLFVVSGLGPILLVFRCLKGPCKTSADHVSLLLLPYLFVCAVASAYNIARFGSPIDFGANYNLTTNDMTHRSPSIEQAAQGVFLYLFQLPVFSFEEPFLRPTDISSAYMGALIHEDMYGGLFFLCPCTLTAFAVFRAPRARADSSVPRAPEGSGAPRGPTDSGDLRNRASSEPLSRAATTAVRVGIVYLMACAVLVVVFDTLAAGLLLRYFLDFGFLFGIAAVLAVLGDVSSLEAIPAPTNIRKPFTWLTVASTGMQLLVFCSAVVA